MRKDSVNRMSWRRATGPTVLGLFIALSGCGTHEVVVPDFIGPAEFGVSLKLSVNPDQLTADGISTSLVQATLFDQNGRPIVGREVFFTIADSKGFSADIGQLRSLTTGVGVGTGLRVRTDASGVAAVVYESPARTDATANQTVIVAVRPVGDDFGGAVYQTVRIELRSAESRLFPQNPAGDLPPKCSFTVEIPAGSCPAPAPAPTPGASPTPTPAPSASPGGGCVVRPNTNVLFQSTATDPDGTIVRYFWDFGNGRQADHADVATSYPRTGTYTVTHVVTDNGGMQAACQATISVQ
jgi:hypothetical protein